MKQNAITATLGQHHLPGIVKYVQPYPSGIQSQTMSRYTIGYIFRGRKRIYIGDSYREAKAGDMFFLDMGTHYIENAPDKEGQFEQISCYYSQAQLANIISTLSTSMQMRIDTHNDCTLSDDSDFVVYQAWGTVRSFFANVNQYIRSNTLQQDNVAEQIKATELLYLLISNSKCGISKRLLGGIDLAAENFEHSIRNRIFDNMSIEEMAHSFNKSMTSFKKEFRSVFGQPPHRWLIQQRLARTKLLLISTSKSISEIGNECCFPNTSHFIKLFKKEFGTTPAAYRTSGGRTTVAQTETPDAAEPMAQNKPAESVVHKKQLPADARQ